MFLYEHHHFSTHIFIQSFQCMERDRLRAQTITTFQGRILPQLQFASEML